MNIASIALLVMNPAIWCAVIAWSVAIIGFIRSLAQIAIAESVEGRGGAIVSAAIFVAVGFGAYFAPVPTAIIVIVWKVIAAVITFNMTVSAREKR